MRIATTVLFLIRLIEIRLAKYLPLLVKCFPYWILDSVESTHVSFRELDV